MGSTQELNGILEKIGPKKIWRPVYDSNGKLLAEGIADERDGHPDDFSNIDFSGKTVVDLGCNLGFYSFLASQKGAEHVLGMDIDRLVIKGAEILRDLHGIEGVDFLCSDFSEPFFSRTFGLTLVVDFFGKGFITQGIEGFLSAIERMTRDGMVISARNHYRIEKHFNGNIKTLKDIYPLNYIRNGRFYLIEYISDYFKRNWEMTILSGQDHDIGSKKTLYFKRK